LVDGINIERNQSSGADEASPALGIERGGVKASLVAAE